MPGIVIRQNTWSGEAPSVNAACSWSVPISRSTGSTSRTTSGSVTKMVARTSPGRANITCTPADWNNGPNQPRAPYASSSARPITTGDSANGKLTTAPMTRLAGDDDRTNTSAHSTPNTVLHPTTTTAISSVNPSACRASGRVTAVQNAQSPSANAFSTTRVTGPAISKPRYTSTSPRNQTGGAVRLVSTL